MTPSPNIHGALWSRGQISDLSLILPGEGKPSRGCGMELGEPVQEPFYTHQVKVSVGGGGLV